MTAHDDAVKAAAEALAALPFVKRGGPLLAAEAAVAAAAPILLAAERQRIAEAIRAEADARGNAGLWRVGMHDAARIAESGP